MAAIDFGIPRNLTEPSSACPAQDSDACLRHFYRRIPGAMLDLHEIVDISEDGVAIQCHSPLELQKRVDLCLDLADCAEHIYTSGQVVWSNASGRAGLRFSDLAPDSTARLREWLFVNVMAGVANGEADGDAKIVPFIGSLDDASAGRTTPILLPRSPPCSARLKRSVPISPRLCNSLRSEPRLWFALRARPLRSRTQIRTS